jgi:hypothetical protein
MAVLTAGPVPPADQSLRGLVRVQATGSGTVDWSAAAVRPAGTVRSWPLLVLAAPAAAEVWSGWVGIAQKTGFGQVSPLPGIWPSLHLDTAITLPVGVEAYAAYALRAWLARDHPVSGRTRRFAKWSAICSLALGMAGQVAYHLLAQAGAARAPWPVTTVVSCLPVLVLAMGTALAHMLRADAAATGTAGWSVPAPQDRSAPDQSGDHLGQVPGSGPLPGSGPPAGTARPDSQDHHGPPGTTRTRSRLAEPQADQARLIAGRLAETGRPVSRRALRSGGVRGSNETLNALARTINAELATAAAQELP